MSTKNAEETAKFAKSPLNYTGGKHKLLPRLVPLMPDDGTDMTFIDLFGGGGNVAANAPAPYTRIAYNELDPNVLSLVLYLVSAHPDVIAAHVDARIREFSLSRDNKDGYLALRAAYNEQPSPRNVGDLFTLVAHAFSNQIRFNRKGEFNLPFGKRTFNDSMRNNLYAFARAWTSGGTRDTTFTGVSFDEFDFSQYPPESTFVYCDPPYLGSMATYNEHGGWTEKDEKKLLALLDELDARGYRWMLSNNFEYDNPLLKQWAEDHADKYTVIDMKHDYKSCNYHKNMARTQAKEAAAIAEGSDSDVTTESASAQEMKEVAIVNYPVDIED